MINYDLIESMAEEFVQDMDYETMKIVKDDLQMPEVKDFVVQYYPDVILSEEEFDTLLDVIKDTAEWYYNDNKSRSYGELREVIEGIIDEYRGNLENVEIGSVLVNIANSYLKFDY